MSGQDPREPLYEDLHHEQLVAQDALNRGSAQLILPLLFERFKPKSVLDVGCGLGTWLAVAQELGVAEIAGLEGAWLDRKLARVASSAITTADLEKPFDLGRRFDLAMTLEVAEHLSAEAAEGFVAALTRHADVILFSAAIPFQGGHHHVNEQFPDYWQAMFEAHGYVPLDFIRPQIWYCSDVLLWLRQNILVYAREALTEGKGPFAALPAAGPLALVHPEMYVARVESILQQYKLIDDLLGAGKTIHAERLPDGRLLVRERKD